MKPFKAEHTPDIMKTWSRHKHKNIRTYEEKIHASDFLTEKDMKDIFEKLSEVTDNWEGVKRGE